MCNAKQPQRKTTLFARRLHKCIFANVLRWFQLGLCGPHNAMMEPGGQEHMFYKTKHGRRNGCTNGLASCVTMMMWSFAAQTLARAISLDSMFVWTGYVLYLRSRYYAGLPNQFVASKINSWFSGCMTGAGNANMLAETQLALLKWTTIVIIDLFNGAVEKKQNRWFCE